MNDEWKPTECIPTRSSTFTVYVCRKASLEFYVAAQNLNKGEVY